MPIAEITHDFAAIQDAVTARYAADLANMEPETVPVEAEVERSATYLFRTRARTTGVFRIAIPGMSAKEQMDEKLAPQLRKVYERKYGKAGLKRFETLRDAVGGPVIAFTPIGPGKGCQYQTDDPDVAAFIREQIPANANLGLYEDYAASSKLRSRWDDTLFPNTEAGRIALARYDQAIEQATTP